MAKVSVIIPVYNTEKYLRKCLDSVCQQTLKDIEIICINDCSTDHSLDILREYAANDSRIKLIDFSENKGAAVARNTGIDAATGEYLGFVDSDDFVDLNFYEKLYDKAIETGADIAKGKIVNYNNKYVSELLWETENNVKIPANKANFIFGFTTAIYKTALIAFNHIRFPENLVNFEDPCFLVKMVVLSNKVVICDKVCYYYVSNNNSVTHNNLIVNQIRDVVKGAELLFDFIVPRASKEDYLVIFNYIMNILIEYANRFPNSDNAIKAASAGMFKLYSLCLYPEDFITFHFITKSEKRKREVFGKIRNNVRRKNA